MKKFVSVLLAVMMVVSLMSISVFAANTTITAPEGDREFEIYQIFTGDLSDKTLSNLAWGSNGIGTGDAADAADDLVGLDGAAAAAAAAALVDWDTEPLDTITDGESISVLTGYYLAKDVSELEDGEAYSLYLVKVVGPVTLAPKADAPEVVKTIVEGNAEVDVNEASVGETVTYKFVGTVPSTIADYATYFYKFTDTLSKGLTYNDDLTVTVNGVDATKYFYVDDSEYSATNGTTITVSIKDLKALALVEDEDEEAVFGAITAATEVVVTYTATVNENAVINGANPNEVDLTYSNDPNDSGTPGTTPPPENPPEEPKPDNPTGKTPKDEVETWVTELTVLKVDENEDPLTGAAFKLTGTGVIKTKVTGTKFEKTPYTAKEGETVQTGTYYLVDGKYSTTAPEETEGVDTYVCVDFSSWITKTETVNVEAYVDGNGVLKFTGLGAGEYTLTEIATPAGYNSIDPITFTISFDDEEKTFSGTDPVEELQSGLTVTIENKPGTVLPETGGIGTQIFYILGGVLVVAAAVVYVTRKRMSAEG